MAMNGIHMLIIVHHARLILVYHAHHHIPFHVNHMLVLMLLICVAEFLPLAVSMLTFCGQFFSMIKLSFLLKQDTMLFYTFHT